MSLYYDNSLDFNGGSNQHSNISLPVKKTHKHMCLSDREESVSDKDLTLIDEAVKLENSARLSRSLDGYSTSFFEDVIKYGDSSNLAKPVGRPLLYKYCFIGQSKLNVEEKYVHASFPIRHFPVYKTVKAKVDKAIARSETKNANMKNSSNSCSVVCPLTEDVGCTSVSKFATSDLNLEVEDTTETYLKDKIRPLGGDNNDPNIDCYCRICHAGTNTGQLISPCHCTGTMGQIHASCLEEWLSFNGRNDCEVCGYEYPVRKENRSFKEFLKYPGDTSLTRDLKHDRCCFAVFTPITLVLMGLLLYAASFPEWKVTSTTIGLILTTVFLAMSYISWSVMAYTFQRQVWQKWRNDNQIVRLKSTSIDYRDYHDNELPATASKGSMTEAHVYMPTSKMTDTSTTPVSDIHIQSSKLQHYDDPKPSVCTDNIPLDLNRRSQSYRHNLATISSATSPTCSIVMKTAFHDVMSAEEMPGKYEIRKTKEKLEYNEK